MEGAVREEARGDEPRAEGDRAARAEQVQGQARGRGRRCVRAFACSWYGCGGTHIPIRVHGRVSCVDVLNKLKGKLGVKDVGARDLCMYVYDVLRVDVDACAYASVRVGV